MHASAYRDAMQFVKKHVKPPLDVLDVGSFDVNGSLRPLFRGCRYVGADIQTGKNVDVVLKDPYHWPELESDSFDLVVSTQVIEHVPRPWAWIREVARVMKPGGLCYICSPNTMPYHEYPVDAWRIWPAGMQAILEEGGLRVVRCHAAGRDTTGIGRKPL